MRKIYALILLLFSCYSLTAQWNSDVAVNLEVSGLKMADMQSAITKSGKTWVAFYHQNAGNYDMRAQLLDASGNKLLGADGILVSNKRSGTATFVFNVCLDANDNLIIATQDQRITAGTNHAVAFKIAQDGSQLWGPDGVVLGPGLSPYPGVLSNGETAFAWNEGTTSTLYLQKVSASGTLVLPAGLPVRVGTSRTSRGQIVANSNGTFTMVFQRAPAFGNPVSTTLFANRFNNDCTPMWAAPLQICNQTSSGARYYSVISENDTTYVGHYSSQGSRFNSFLLRINPDGTLPYGINGASFNTSTAGTDPYQQMTNIALMPGSPYVWSICTFSNSSQSQYGIYVQKFLKKDGSRLFGNTGKNVYPISTNFDTQTGNVSLIDDAPMFMHYNINYKIYASRLDGNGDFVWTGNKVELSSTTAGGSTPKGRFNFAGLSGNQAIAVWYESRGTEYRGYAQNITPAGLFKLVVKTQASVPAAITTSLGTLQMAANVFPATANQNVIWSIVPGTTNATISATGLVTAQIAGNGTVWAKAVSAIDPIVMDSMLINISGQITPVSSLDVQTQGGVQPVISTGAGTLQMVAVISPSNATDKNVTWSIIPVTGKATISAGGLVSPLDDGTVWAKAVSVQNPAAKDSMLITISGQWANNRLTGMVVYPNPASSEVHLRLLKNHKQTLMRIVDMAGKVVYSELLAPNALRTEKVINVGTWLPGMYIIRFEGGVIFTSFKFIKL